MPGSNISYASIPTHWSGPLATGETVLMIINPYDEPKDITFQWRHIPAFQNSPAIIFYFAEISTREVRHSGSSVGFVYGGVPAHGSVVMIVWEGGKFVEGKENDEWAYRLYLESNEEIGHLRLEV